MSGESGFGSECCSRRTFLKQTGLAAVSLPFADASMFDLKAYQLDKTKDHYQVPTICRLCRARCPLIARVHPDRTVTVSGNPASTFHGGKSCARAQAAGEMLRDPDRLKHPLKRTGQRGEGRWQRISWDEAVDTIASRLTMTLKKHGPGAIALVDSQQDGEYLRSLWHKLGATRIVNSRDEFCQRNQRIARGFGQQDWFRSFAAFAPGDLDTIVFLGSHLGENVDVAELHSLSAHRRHGARLIVADPRFSVLAGKAEVHLMLRPGMDQALLFGWMHILLLEKQLVPEGSAVRMSAEFIKLRDLVRAYPVERVAALLDVSAEVLRKSADLLFASPQRTWVHPGRFSAWHGNDVARLTTIACMNRMLHEGGGVAPGDMHAASAVENDFSVDEAAFYSLHALMRDLESGAVSVLGCQGQNPLMSFPNPYRTAAALNKAEFIFASDILPSEITLYADIVLPAASFLERSDMVSIPIADKQEMVALSFAATEPLADAKESFWFTSQLASRLGHGSLFPEGDLLRHLDSILRRKGLSAATMYASGGLVMMDRDQEAVSPLPAPLPANTASEQSIAQPIGSRDALLSQLAVNVSFPENATDLQQPPAPENEVPSSFPDIISFLPPHLPPKGYARLLSGRLPVHGGGATTNNPWLLREIGENELWVNTKIAEILGVKHGEEVSLINQDGLRSVMPVKVKITAGIRPDCLFLAHGFGAFSPHLSKAFGRGTADGAMLTRGQVDPQSGVAGLRGNFVTLVRKEKILAMPVLDARPAELKTARFRNIDVTDRGTGHGR